MKYGEQFILKLFPLHYSVSSLGRVRNDKNGYILKGGLQNGYYSVSIPIAPGKNKHFRINRLVAQAFIPNPHNKQFVNHIDGDKSNNNVNNLEWVTPSENAIHAYKTGLRVSNRSRRVNQYNLLGHYMMTFDSLHEAEIQTGVSQPKITEVCQGSRKTAGDYQWRYYDGNIDNISSVQERKSKKRKVAQCNLEGEIIAIYESYCAAARAVGGTQSAISRICAGTPGLHTHKGFVWKIVDDIVQEIDE